MKRHGKDCEKNLKCILLNKKKLFWNNLYDSLGKTKLKGQ